MKSSIIALVLATAAAVKLPENFPKCNRKKPDFEECMLKAAQTGISQLTRPYDEVSIPNLNPFELPEIKISGGNEGAVRVDQTFRNCKIYGLNTMKVDKYRLDFESKTSELKGYIPEAKMICDYQMKGQILVIPVDGKGTSTIVLKNLKISQDVKFEEKKKKNKSYIRIVESKLNLDPELVTFDFQSSDNSALTNNLNPILNDNWKEIFGEVKGTYEEILSQVIVKTCNRFFNKVSIEEAFDDD